MNEPFKFSTIRIGGAKPWDLFLVPGSVAPVNIDTVQRRITIGGDTVRFELIHQLIDAGRKLTVYHLADTPGMVAEMLDEARERAGERLN